MTLWFKLRWVCFGVKAPVPSDSVLTGVISHLSSLIWIVLEG